MLQRNHHLMRMTGTCNVCSVRMYKQTDGKLVCESKKEMKEQLFENIRFYEHTCSAF